LLTWTRCSWTEAYATFYIFLSVIATILALIVKTKWKETKTLGKISFLVTAIGLGIGGYLEYKSLRKSELLEKINSSFGEISDRQDVTIPLMALGFSKNNAMVGGESLRGSIVLGHFTVIQVYIKNHKLNVTTIIRDKSGEPILAILDNEWTIYKNDFEYNYDENSIEIVSKGERIVFFHLKLLDGVVYTEGSLYTKNGNGINICPSDGMNSKIVLLDKNTIVDNSTLKRIFKYPIEKYIGVREP
jgi:hypothetical protein